MEKFLQTQPPITKAKRFFHTLFAQHVSTLNWVLFRCSFTTELSQQKIQEVFNKNWLTSVSTPTPIPSFQRIPSYIQIAKLNMYSREIHI
jgi:hypothetical protein